MTAPHHRPDRADPTRQASGLAAWHTVAAAAQAPQPWRNGGGVTRPLFADRAGEAWRLRLSLADIGADGPFSAFPGVRRWFAVVQGAGVCLGLATGDRTVTVDTPPLAFDGAEAPACRLVGGPTRDLNLMLRGVAGGLAAAVAGAPWAPPAAAAASIPAALVGPAAPGLWRGLFTVAAAQLSAGDDHRAVPPMALSLCTAADRRPWTLHTSGRAWWLWAEVPDDGLDHGPDGDRPHDRPATGAG